MELLGRTLFSKSKRVLNVGGGNTKAVLNPVRYKDMRQFILDIDPRMNPDVLCDALEMREKLKRNSFDAIFCAHNLEHYYHHHVKVVLSGMFYVLKPGGFVEIRVPDILTAIALMTERGLDLEDRLYMSPAGPIATLDMIYGWRLEIERSGQPFYAHKTAFTPKSLHKALSEAGFTKVEIYKCPEIFELQAIGVKP